MSKVKRVVLDEKATVRNGEIFDEDGYRIWAPVWLNGAVGRLVFEITEPKRKRKGTT
jgi:hypothetical protein